MKKIFLSALSGALLLVPQISPAQEWALDGIDPVSYSEDGAALPGRTDIVTLWHGKTWHFVSESNRDSFEANPKAFTPALDGYCVVALAEGRSEPGDPRYFVIIAERTYLTRSPQARDELIAHQAKLLSEARKNFVQLQN